MAVGVVTNATSRKMSSQAASPSPAASRQPTWSFKIQNFATPQTYAAKSVVDLKAAQTPTSPTQTPTAGSSTQETQTQLDDSNEQRKVPRSRKRRRLNEEEEEMKNEIAKSVAANLELDQIMTLYPDADTPFENELDVVHRLLPYHIFQHPQHDLNEMRGLKGKAKANEADLLREEIQETKFALECHKRLRSLEQRMKKARLKPGQNTIPLDQAILVERLLLESEHLDSSALDQELSSARSELDKVLRAQRLAKQAANRSTLTTSGSTSINGTTNHTTPSYYGYATSTFNASSTPNYSNYYSSYTYPYAQSFIPGVSYTQSAKTGTSAIPGASSFPTGASAQAQSSTSSANQVNASSPSTSAPARPPPIAIPLQLPVTSLPALQSLGILPVPQASLASSPNQQPAAVLLGSSNNGTMLSLEINAALLQPPQMSGLAILLSSLVKMSGGSSDTGQTQTAGASATTTTQNASNSAATAQTAAETAAGYENGSK